MHSLARNLINPTGYTSIDGLGIPRKILRLLSVFFTPSGRKKYRPDVGIFRFKNFFLMLLEAYLLIGVVQALGSTPRVHCVPVDNIQPWNRLCFYDLLSLNTCLLI